MANYVFKQVLLVVRMKYPAENSDYLGGHEDVILWCVWYLDNL